MSEKGPGERLFTREGSKKVDGWVVVVLTIWSVVCVLLGFGFGYMAFGG